jgi:hypothetical protein
MPGIRDIRHGGVMAKNDNDAGYYGYPAWKYLLISFHLATGFVVVR